LRFRSNAVRDVSIGEQIRWRYRLQQAELKNTTQPMNYNFRNFFLSSSPPRHSPALDRCLHVDVKRSMKRSSSQPTWRKQRNQFKYSKMERNRLCRAENPTAASEQAFVIKRDDSSPSTGMTAPCGAKKILNQLVFSTERIKNSIRLTVTNPLLVPSSKNPTTLATSSGLPNRFIGTFSTKSSSE